MFIMEKTTSRIIDPKVCFEGQARRTEASENLSSVNP